MTKDLRLMEYAGNNKWCRVHEELTMIELLNSIVQSFQILIHRYNDLIHNTSTEIPDIMFKASDFAKLGSYKTDSKGVEKKNIVKTIVDRLKANHLEKYIPVVGDRVSYLVILDKQAKQEHLEGKVGASRIGNRSFLIEELYDKYHAIFPAETFKHAILTYSQFIELKIISKLDFRYYLECLCKATSLYTLEERYEDFVKRIDSGSISEAEAGKLTDKYKKEIAKIMLSNYFHYNAVAKSNIKKINKVVEYKNGDIKLLYSLIPELEHREMTLQLKNVIITKLTQRINEVDARVKPVIKLYKKSQTDSFVYDTLNSDTLSTELNKLHLRLSRLNAALKVARGIQIK
jgi:hypothetical protein